MLAVVVALVAGAAIGCGDDAADAPKQSSTSAKPAPDPKAQLRVRQRIAEICARDARSRGRQVPPDAGRLRAYAQRAALSFASAGAELSAVRAPSPLNAQLKRLVELYGSMARTLREFAASRTTNPATAAAIVGGARRAVTGYARQLDVSACG